MLTPKFSLKQNNEYLFIQLHVPFFKFESAECDVNGDEFYFSASPYYLRLHLPGNVVNDDRLRSEYDSDQRQLNIRVAKETPGQRFEGLDMLTKLLTPKHKVVVPNIEVVGSKDEIDEEQTEFLETDPANPTSDGNIESEEEIEFDWFVEQKIPEETIQIKSPLYGFAHQKCNIVNGVCSELDMIDLKDPDNVPVSDRRLLRQNQEEDKFDCEHYLADLFDNALIQDIIAAEYPSLKGTCSDNDFSEVEKERLMRLPRREYLIDEDILPQVYLGLVDLVYAYSYNYRFCGGEHNIESDWTICKLSSTLSWFDSFHNLKDILISCARRTVCFPLYRSWKLFLKVLADVEQIFKAGRNQILKCLLGIHSILEKSENHYPLNDLYITDYCVWIQSADCSKINSLAANLSKLEISKADIGLSIFELEADAEKMMADCESEDDEDVNKLSKKMKNVVLVEDADCSDSDDDESDSDDDTTESCSECKSTCSEGEEKLAIENDGIEKENECENDVKVKDTCPSANDEKDVCSRANDEKDVCSSANDDQNKENVSCEHN